MFTKTQGLTLHEENFRVCSGIRAGPEISSDCSLDISLGSTDTDKPMGSRTSSVRLQAKEPMAQSTISEQPVSYKLGTAQNLIEMADADGEAELPRGLTVVDEIMQDDDCTPLAQVWQPTAEEELAIRILLSEDAESFSYAPSQVPSPQDQVPPVLPSVNDALLVSAIDDDLRMSDDLAGWQTLRPAHGAVEYDVGYCFV